MIDSTFYTTVNMLRTMEILLGLPPMNNNDARAAFMGDLLSGTGNQPPFSADRGNLENKLIYRVNAKDSEASRRLGLFTARDASDAGPAERACSEGSNGRSGRCRLPAVRRFSRCARGWRPRELRRSAGQPIFYVAKASCKYSGYFSANETQPRVLPKSILISHFF